MRNTAFSENVTANAIQSDQLQTQRAQSAMQRLNSEKRRTFGEHVVRFGSDVALAALEEKVL